MEHFDECFGFIKEGLEHGGVLVHWYFLFKLMNYLVWLEYHEVQLLLQLL